MDISKITPITQLKILRGVRSDSSLGDVLTHANVDTQRAYFEAKAKKTTTGGVPVRNNVVRVPFIADDIYDCNYVMWQNANFSNKWFYGWITNIRWVNVNVSELTILPDPWETWKFNLTFVPCYVERMHVNNDTVGKWKSPEPFDVSSKLMRLRDVTNLGSNYKIAIFYVPNTSYEPSVVNELVNMCVTHVCDNYDDFLQYYYEHLQPLIDQGLTDNIIGGVVVPSFIKANGKHVYQKALNRKNYMNLDNYVPANKKLLTFPYNSLRVATQNGLQGEYWFEKFSNDTMNFSVGGCVAIDMMLYGDFETYERESGTPESIPNMPYTNVVSGFPQPLFSGAQSIGYAQAASSLAMQAIAGVKEFSVKEISSPAASIMFGLAGGKLDSQTGGMVSTAVTNAKNQTLQLLENTPLADLQKGYEADLSRKAAADYAVITSLPSSTAAWSIFRGEFQFLHSTIDAVKAEQYDTYLTRWGYAVDDIIAPLIRGRKVFNYVKTRGCNCYGNIPAQDLSQIRAMFDRGVTLWHNESGYEPGAWSGAPNGNPIV